MEDFARKIATHDTSKLSFTYLYTYIFGQSSNFGDSLQTPTSCFFLADKHSLSPRCGLLLLLQHICFKVGRVVHSDMHFQSGPASPADLQHQPDITANRNGHLYFFPFLDGTLKSPGGCCASVQKNPVVHEIIKPAHLAPTTMSRSKSPKTRSWPF